ncbi:MAG: protein phosphatase 2C domain-containing protein [Candidatus Caldatribacteriaceae bacterium]
MDVAGFIVGDRIISLAFATHPDWNAGFGRKNGFSFVGASAVGKLHLQAGRGREDSFLIRSKGEWLLLLVADGVGSATLGAWGASLAVNFFAEELFKTLPAGKKKNIESFKKREKRWRGYGVKIAPFTPVETVGTLSWYRERISQKEDFLFSPQECVEQVLEVLEKTHIFLLSSARRENRNPSALATTLLGILFDTVVGKGLAFQIGDGLILKVSHDDSVPLIISPDFGVGETAVLTQSDWRRWCRWESFVWGKETQALFLMTDGVADDCLYAPPEGILQLFGQDLVREIKRFPDEETVARRLLYWLSHYEVRSSFDDRTLLALYQ